MTKQEEIREDIGNKLFNAFGNIKRARELAGEIVQYLLSQGVVIKVREALDLEDTTPVVVEPLI